MIYDDTPRVHLTRGQLDTLLQQLGYTRHDSEEMTVYFEKESDTLLPLPPAAPEEVVPLHHLMLARATSDRKGVAEKHQFDALLSEVIQSSGVPIAA
jgi:hypothetical protein